jgi:anhydro-N-acetylmuramic acid kinase
MSQSRLIVGLMSGTSLDGIDAVLLRVEGSGRTTRFVQLAYLEQAFPRGLRALVLKNSVPETSRVDEITRLNVLLAQLYAAAVRRVAKKARIPLIKIDLIGSHGQTIHHLPHPVRMFGHPVRATLQIGDPSVLATLTGIPTVGNFRNADMAVGGEGAPLVPYFDWLMFRSRTKGRILLNIGGIGNITVLPRGCDAGDVVAFDTGPGNMLVDALMQKYFGMKFDTDGAVASRGRIMPHLFRELANHPFLRRCPPKSTGREEFGKEMVGRIVAAVRRETNALRHGKNSAPRGRHADIICTVAAVTPFAVHDAYKRFVPASTHIDELFISGGGARNQFFVRELERLFTGIRVRMAEEIGISGDAKEAICFAILANETVHGHCANLPGVTGASRPVVLGVLSNPGKML